MRTEYDLLVAGVNAHLIQYAVAGERGGLAFTFAGPQGASSTDDFDKILDSIRLLSR